MARAVHVSVVFLCHAASGRVGMFLDAFIIEYFKAKPASGPPTLMNDALAEYIRSHDLEDTVRRVIREELSRLK